MRGHLTAKHILSGMRPRSPAPGSLGVLDSFELVDRKVEGDGKAVGFNSALAIVRAFREEFLDRRCKEKTTEKSWVKNAVDSRSNQPSWNGWLGETDSFHAEINQSLFQDMNGDLLRTKGGPHQYSLIESPFWPGYQLKLTKNEEEISPEVLRRERFLGASRSRANRLGEGQHTWRGWIGEIEQYEANFENGLYAHFQNLGLLTMKESLGQSQVHERELFHREDVSGLRAPDSEVSEATSVGGKRAIASVVIPDHSIRLRRRASLKIFSQMIGETIEKLRTVATSLFPGEDISQTYVLTEPQQELMCEHFGLASKRAPEIKTQYETTTDLRLRAPVACVMGHVDHGKTTLLDALRRTNVAKKEAGGITQSIGAFMVSHNNQNATFLDTPGHAAFSAMRTRGASKHLTDIIVLVVSVDAGVQVQTREAIKLAQKNNVPLVVAVSKCDLDMDPQVVRRQLLSAGVQVESEGGDVLAVNISAKTGEGLDELAEAIDLTAQMLELKVPYDGYAEAALIELRLVKGAGVVAHGIVRRGTMKVGDYFVCGRKYGKIKQLLDETGKNRIQEAPPSTPVGIVGLGMEFESVIEEDFISVPSEEIAKRIVAEREAEYTVALQGQQQRSEATDESSGPRLRVLIKADVHGSIRALTDYIQSLPTDVIKVEVIRSGLGDISVTDIEHAKKLNAHVFGFGVSITRDGDFQARAKSVPVTCHTVIFHLIDSLKDTLSNMLPPQKDAILLGFAEVLMRIELNGKGKSKRYCAGCSVKQGQLKSTSTFRVRREQTILYEGPLATLQHYKNKVNTIEKGSECSLHFESYTDFQKGDIIECITTELRKRVFDDGRARDGTLRANGQAYA